jgi:dipeptidyl aminopeptidase/acylaminoacyl peptidase
MSLSIKSKSLLLGLLLSCLLIGPTTLSAQPADKIDWNKARQLYQKEKSGEALTKAEKSYLDRAKEARRNQRNADTTGDNERSRSTIQGIAISRELCPIHKITATAEDDKQIRAFYRKPPGDGPFPAVICIHGGVTSASDNNLRSLLLENAYTRLLAAGYVTVAGDFRTYQATPKARGPILDCLATVRAVKKVPFVDGESVVVFGGSGGGSLALELAATTKLAAIVCGEPATLLFCGMLEDGEFGKRFEVVAEPHKYFTEERKALTQKKIKMISCPVVILHGDQHGLKKLNKDIFLPELKAAGVEVEYKVYPGNPHGFYWGRSTTKETVEKFLTDVDTFVRPKLKTKPKQLNEGEPPE